MFKKLCYLMLGAQLFSMGVAFAWERVQIPGAVCGDGSPYFAFVEQGDPQKLAFILMGGGACWSGETCWGPNLRAWIHTIPVMPDVGGITSSKPAENPAWDFTKVFFPYCTGDVHLGEHIANYKGPNVQHVGKLNVIRTYQHLAMDRYIDFSTVKKFMMYGYSAGAIGALFHFQQVDTYLPKDADKILVADAPGLHFGDTFWEKFPPAWLGDVDRALSVVGYKRGPGVGMIAGIIPEICASHPDWRVYVMQGSRDWVMSELFGEISQDDHHQKIFSKSGVYALTSNRNDNCSSWIPTTDVHTFMALDFTSQNVYAGGINASDFLRGAIAGDVQLNYR